MRTPTFLTFLKKRAHRKDLVGYFAREWIADHRNGKPTASQGLKGIVTYLKADDATNSKIAAARLSWDEWMLTSSDNGAED